MTGKHERPWLEGAKAAVGETSQQVDPIAPTPVVTTQPEAAELPEGVVTLADALRELAATLPVLRDVLKRQAPPAVPPLAYRKGEAARMVGISPRLVERLLAAGKFPRPDAHAGRCPLWTRSTLERWVAEGGGRI
jgi:hypothetical protein